MNVVPGFEFPESFFWGAATASHQVEGDNRWNDWWLHEEQGRLPFRSGKACDHYNRYEEDFDLVASWGHNAHRFSIEWSRIEPEEGKWNEDAVAHYAAVIEALRKRGIEPFITLHHFTNPAWFAAGGGWSRHDASEKFGRFVELVASRLPTVRYWITINEPTVYVKNGYISGDWPPFRKSSWLEGARVLMNMARAHVAAYGALHAGGRDVQVGFAHSAPFVEPCGCGGWRDRVAARIRDMVLNDAFFSLVRLAGLRAGDTGCLDFIGVNYYTRTRVRGSSSGVGLLFGTECRAGHHADQGPDNDLGWEVYAPGLLHVLQRFSRRRLPIFVTENGLAGTDDDRRARFIIDHLRSVSRAWTAGVDVRGYFHWTLMDNYEWTHGYQTQFGLAAVDRESGRRIPRESGSLYADICRNNGATSR